MAWDSPVGETPPRARSDTQTVDRVPLRLVFRRRIREVIRVSAFLFRLSKQAKRSSDRVSPGRLGSTAKQRRIARCAVFGSAVDSVAMGIPKPTKRGRVEHERLTMDKYVTSSPMSLAFYPQGCYRRTGISINFSFFGVGVRSESMPTDQSFASCFLSVFMPR